MMPKVAGTLWNLAACSGWNETLRHVRARSVGKNAKRGRRGWGKEKKRKENSGTQGHIENKCDWMGTGQD